MKERMWDVRQVWSVNFGRPKYDLTFEWGIEKFCERLTSTTYTLTFE